MKRREFIIGAASMAFGVSSVSEILLANGKNKGTVELHFKNAKKLKGLSGEKLRKALAEQLIIRSDFEGKLSGRLVMFRVVKGKIKDQFVSDLLKLTSGDMYVPGNMYLPGDMYVPGEMFKNARGSAMETLDGGSGFFFILMAESKSIKNKGGALPTK